MKWQVFRDGAFLIFAFLLGAWLQDAFPAQTKEERKAEARDRAARYETCAHACFDKCREAVK